MKFYITKHVFTDGIIEVNGEICHNISDKMISVNMGRYNQHYHKPFWHETREDAVKHAEKIRERKIISLKKSIVKIENIVF